MIEHELPEGWQIKTLGETCSKGQYGYTTSANDNGDIRLLRTTDISKYYLNWDSVPFCEENPTEINKYLLQDNDVLISRAGSIGYSYLIKSPPYKTVFASYLIRFKPDMSILTPEYLILYLKSNYYWQQITDMSAGVALANINATKLQKLKIIIPPLTIQHQIVTKIEQLFCELDDGVNILQTLKSTIKTYRLSILNQCFGGDWEYKKFGKVAEISRGKSKHRPRNDKSLFGGTYPFIQTGEIRAANGGVISRFKNTYSELGLAQSKLWKKGTLCLTIAANIAETAFLGFDACFPDSVVGICTDENELSTKFVNYYIQKLKHEIDSQASATAQKNINVEFLEKLDIPIPSIKEQNQIVTKIEELFATCDELDQTIYNALNQSQLLRQSILKQAFSGKLICHCEEQSDEAIYHR